MKFIEKPDTPRLISGEVSIANEAYEDALPMAVRSLVEKLVAKFMEEFDHEPHSSWFSKTETGESALNLTRIEMQVTFPDKGDEVMVEGERIKLPVVLNEHSRLPVKQQAEVFVDSDAADGWDHPIRPTPIYTARHIGWDADTGLMVFGRWDG